MPPSLEVMFQPVNGDAPDEERLSVYVPPVSAAGSPVAEIVDASAPVSSAALADGDRAAEVVAPVRIRVFEPACVSDPAPPIVFPAVIGLAPVG